jgi:hypothetical protein
MATELNTGDYKDWQIPPSAVSEDRRLGWL